jgi:biotin carboxyl carrier protein
MLRRKVTYSLAVLATIIISTSGCNQTTPPIEDNAPVITPVTIVPVNYKPVEQTIDLPAVTAFINKSIVRSATTGTVESISVVLGDRVKKDQPIYTIRTRESSAIKNTLKGDSSLSFNGNIVINAPRDGVISSVSHQNGDFVQEGDELAVISEQNSLVFILDTPFEFVKFVEQTRNCKIQLPDKQIITGVVSGRLPEMDPQAQTVRYLVRSVSAVHFPSNMNAIISIVKERKQKAAILPKSSVLGNETQTEFWIMKLINDSTAVKVPVTKGFENNEEVEIITPEFLLNDRIILQGSYGLPDTARISIK